ncbi:MAG: hypothetical protein WDW36_008446 [Sanguina aurantia]
MSKPAAKAGASKKSASDLQQKSPAEFFSENKNIAGFDNPGKCLYTTIRELVENALDSAESISELPLIEIDIEEVSKARLNTIRGLDHQERIDEELYHDFETGDVRKKRLAKEAKDQGKIEKILATKGEGAAATAAAVQRKEAPPKPSAARGQLFYKVTVKDNGSGMPHADIPNMLGRVLSGTKYGVKQTRGKFGLGAKMALIWSKMTTGMPFDIRSAQVDQKFVSHYILDIDIHRNEPNVHKAEKLQNDSWHGASLSLTIEGNWTYYRSKIIKYLRQIAVITPYAQFAFSYKSEDDKGNLKLLFRRRTDIMPEPPRVTKHHPSSVDLELIKRLIACSTAATLLAFLRKDFDSIGQALAERLIGEVRTGVEATTAPKSLTSAQVVRLYQLLHEARFSDPKGDHLSPAGEYNLRLGVMKELRPELIATHQSNVCVFEGHAFIVEAAVSIGGKDMKPGISVHRFANRIPLLFEGGSDVITKTSLRRINWTAYKINQNTDKVGVFVSIVSTKIPFKGAGKEYIGDDIEEMVGAVKGAIQACCLQLKAKISRAQSAKEQESRKRNLTRYIPDVTSSIIKVLEKMAAGGSAAAAGGPKRAKLQQGDDLLVRVASKAVTEQTLAARLLEHIERIDTDMALEYQVAQGMVGAAKERVALMPLTSRHSHGPELHTKVAVIKLMQAFR